MSGFRSSLIISISVMVLIAACAGGGDSVSSDTVDSSTTTFTATPTTTETSEHEEDTHEEEDDHDDGSSDHEESSEHDDDTTGSADRTVDVKMTEFAFEPGQIEVAAGETVRFVITNHGLVDHEFRLSNAHRIEEHMASGHEDHEDDAGVHHEEGGDVFIVLKAGETSEVVMTFPEDSTLYTEMACLLPGHYEAGMTAPVMYGDA